MGLLYVDSVIHLGFGDGNVRADEYAQEELEYDEGSGDHPDGDEHRMSAAIVRFETAGSG